LFFYVIMYIMKLRKSETDLASDYVLSRKISGGMELYMADKFLIVDGSSLLHRAFFALPPLMNSKGQHTGAVYGLCNMLLRLLREVKPKWMAVAFDKSRHTFRTELYPDYKGQRKPTPEELKEQFPLSMQVLQTLNIPVLELDDYEADDIIGTLAAKSGPAAQEVIVVTGDRDELQLLDDRVKVYYTKRGISEIQEFDEAVFAQEYEGLKPLQLIDLKGLMGDSSDNIPGVAGVGPKTALKLIGQYGSVEQVLANIDQVSGKSLKAKLEAHKEEALLSKKLATICTAAPVELQLEHYLLSGVGPEAAELLRSLEFRNFYERFAAVLGQAGQDQPAAGEQGAGSGTSTSASGTSASGGDEVNQDGMSQSAGRALGLQTQGAVMKGQAGPVAPDSQAASAASAGSEPSLPRSGEASPAAANADGSFDLFGAEAAQPAYEEKTITGEVPAVELLNRAGQSRDLVWFRASVMGEIPTLHFSEGEILYEGTLYHFSGEEALKPFTRWLASSCPKGTLDSKEIFKAARCQQMEPQHIQEDLLLAAYLDDPGQSSYALPKLIERYLVGSFKDDSYALSKLGKVLLEQLTFKKLVRMYKELELPLTQVLASLELAGVAADKELLEEKNQEMAAQLKTLEAKAKEEAGDPDFNPQSTKQLGVILFDKLGLPAGKKTKTGYSTDVSVLEQLEGQHPLVGTILQLRVLSKLHSTYLEGMKPLINKTTGRIHTHFQQTVTVTGRLSSTDPNLQNIPTRTEIGRGIREIFVPGEGYDWLLSCDYSQIELRILAHIAKDELLLESFLKNQDVHARTASEVFGVPLAEVTPELRRRAKAVNFGIVYGISDFGLAKQIGSSRKEAGQFIENYFARYTGVKTYMEQTVAQAREQGFVTTLLGRRRYLPDIRSSNFNRRSFAERTAINTPIQGTAADIMKLAMLRVDAALKKARVKSRVLLQVHDELVLEVTREEREAVGQLVQREMQNAFTLAVPLLAEVEYGVNWSEC